MSKKGLLYRKNVARWRSFFCHCHDHHDDGGWMWDAQHTWQRAANNMLQRADHLPLLERRSGCWRASAHAALLAVLMLWPDLHLLVASPPHSACWGELFCSLFGFLALSVAAPPGGAAAAMATHLTSMSGFATCHAMHALHSPASESDDQLVHSILASACNNVCMFMTDRRLPDAEPVL